MKFSMQHFEYDDTIRVTLELTYREYRQGQVDVFDRVLIRDCEGSDKASDKLLALETIVRRLEQGERSGAEYRNK